MSLKTKISPPETDRIYYNINIVNNTNQSIVASYSERKNDSILENPSEWKVAVERFSIPGTEIPIFNFGQNAYYVTIEFDGFSETLEVPFISHNNIDPNDRGVYTYSEFLNSISYAFLFCYTNYQSNHPGLLPPISGAWYAPQLNINPETQIISIYIPENIIFGGNTISYLTTGYPPGAKLINIYMNTRLFDFFKSFETNFNGHGRVDYKDFQIVFNNNYLIRTTIIEISTSTSVNAYQNKQNYVSLWSWVGIQSIIMATSSLPIQQEYVPFVDGIINGNSSSRAILTDFQVPVDNQLVSNFYFQYNANNRRYINLLSNTPLSQIDLQLYWQDANQNLYPIYISPYNNATVKLVFIKKSSLSVN